MIRPGDWMQSIWQETSDIEFGSYGLDQCLDLVETALRAAAAMPKPDGDDWARRHRHRARHAGMRAADGASLGRRDELLADGSYHLAVGSTEMGNGSVTSHRQIAAAVLGSRAEQIAIINADTDLHPYDTGTFASTGTVVAGQAVALTAAALRDNILTSPPVTPAATAADCRLEDDAVICGNQQIAARRAACGRRQVGAPLRGQAQGLSVAAHGRLQCAWRPRRGASRHRRDPHPAERACRRYRPADQSRCSAAARSTAPSPWASAGRSTRRWSTTRRAR